jgi:hypothetical protein
MSDIIYYKNGEKTFRISPPTVGTKCPETKLEVKKMTEIEKTEGEIKVLQAKLELLKEMENFKTPVEEAYKRVYGNYPMGEPFWIVFKKGYEAHQSLVDDANKIKAVASMTNCIIKGNPPYGYVTWHDWYDALGSKGILRNLRISAKEYQPKEKEQKWDVVRESVKWCEEHPDESVEDYLKPQTPDKIEENLREAFQKVQQTEEWKETQKLIDEEDSDKNFKNSLDLIKEWGEKNKPPTLYEILMDWWINHLDMEQSDEEIVDGLVDMIDKKFIPPSSDRNGYEWERGMKMIRDKLRNKK